ncbi:MAG: presenilin family intramembrane aspartyl protease [Candidatus Thermoplasmatota archaeon]|jgi:presenilin-like A22 family membrane protease|nr:presenilin family intramembrane aspartyl protease [Candidatus Thermoplasmatota archaeon]
MADKKDSEKKMIFPIFIMGCFFVIINGFALLMKNLFQPTFEDVNNPVNVLYIFVIIIVMTVIILLIARYWKKQVIQVIILFAIGYTAFFIFIPLLSFLPEMLCLALSVLLAIALVVALYKYPEWYIIDICGVIVGAGAIAIFGISLSVLLVIILLVVLAVYDAISVYQTKHMIDLADTVMDLKLPVLLVVPKIWRYSLINETKTLKEKLQEHEERDAFFMGLGDIVMPGILVVAAYQNIPNGLPVALSVLAGTLIGFSVLMTFVIKGKPQAGLPLLCSGAILGYLISSFVFFGTLVGLGI